MCASYCARSSRAAATDDSVRTSDGARSRARAQDSSSRGCVPCERPYERAKRPATLSGACVDKFAKEDAQILRTHHLQPGVSLESYLVDVEHRFSRRNKR